MTGSQMNIGVIPDWVHALNGPQPTSAPPPAGGGVDLSRLFNGSWTPSQMPIFANSATDPNGISFQPAGQSSQWVAGPAPGVAGGERMVNTPDMFNFGNGINNTGRGSNWQSNFGLTQQQAADLAKNKQFQLMVKNSQGTGQNTTYGLDPSGKYWVPVSDNGTQAMGTNHSNLDAILAAAGMFGTAAAGGAIGAGAAAGADAGAGVGAGTAPAYMGVGTAGAGAAGEGIGAGAALEAGAGVGAGVAPAYGGVGTSGAGAAGEGLGGAETVGGTTAGAGTAAGSQPAYMGPGSAGAGAAGEGAGSSMGSSIWDALQNGNITDYLKSNPQAIGQLGSMLSGWLSNNRQTANASNMNQQRADAEFQYAGQTNQLAQQAAQRGQFSPVGYTNANGSTTFDPTTNTWKTSLSPDQQQQAGMWQGLGNSALSQYKNLDPNAIAAQRFAANQALIAPGRQAATDSMLGRLKASGQMGLGVTDSNGINANPLMSSFLAANNQQDRQMALDAQDYGISAQNQGLQKLNGLFGNYNNVLNSANTTQNPALNFTGQMQGNNQFNNQMLTNLGNQSNNAVLNANLPNSTLFNTQQGNTASDYGMWGQLFQQIFANNQQGTGTPR